jgi:MFS family permease
MTRPGRIVAIICVAEILGMSPFSMFLAVQTELRSTWQLSNTAIGWISSGYYAGYMAAVPVLASLTDRMDARTVWLAATSLAAAAAVGFGIAADGLWTALPLQILAGASLAGTYMPGLKLIADRLGVVPHPRYVALYTTSFTIGSSLSFYWIGQLVEVMTWRLAMVTIAAGPALAWALMFFFIPPMQPHGGGRGAEHGRWREVFRSAEAMRFVAGYACHMWELFGVRAWLVPFLTFCAIAQGRDTFASPATLAALIALVGVPASLAGAELSARFDRRVVILVVMTMAAAASVAFGLSAAANWAAILTVGVIYTVFISADSAALTAGIVAVAPAGSRGTAMALYSMAGFAAASAGSAIVGSVLDVAGGESVTSWAIAFGVLGASNVVGALLLGGTVNSQLPTPNSQNARAEQSG